MRVLVAFLSVLLVGGEAPPQRAVVAGFVCARRGAGVILYAPGAQVGQEFLVGRPGLLISLASSGKKTYLWAKWEPAGRLRVRQQLASNYFLAQVVEETHRSENSGENIRPGDPVFKPPGSKGALPW